MKKVLITILLLLTLAILPMVSADTEISVKTLKFHQVNVFVLQGGEVYQLLEEFHEESDKYGRVNVISKINDPTIDLLVNVKWNGNQVVAQKFEDLSTSEKIEVTLPESAKEIPDAPAEENTTEGNETKVTEETGTEENSQNPEEETTTEEENPAQEPTTTGNTVLDNETESNSPKTFWFIGIGLIVVVIALFLMKKMFSGSTSQPQQFGTGNSPKDFDQKRTEMEIEKAERRIKEAQVEINKIKNEGKIKEAQKKIEEDRQKLDKLKRGEDEDNF